MQFKMNVKFYFCNIYYLENQSSVKTTQLCFSTIFPAA